MSPCGEKLMFKGLDKGWGIVGSHGFNHNKTSIPINNIGQLTSEKRTSYFQGYNKSK